MKTIGDAVIDAVIKAGAIQDVIKEGEAMVIVWRANSAEQIEAALRPAMENHIRASSQRADLIEESYGLLKVGYGRRDNPSEVMRRIIANVGLTMCGITIPAAPKEDA